jgi:hypothetical protein
MIETPEKYKRFLKKVGGLTDYGEPSYLLIWGENQTITQLTIPQPFLNPYFNCWILAEWRRAEDFGSPSDWPDDLGPYPNRGGYVPLAVFRDEKREPSKLDSEDLNFEVLRMWIFYSLKHENDRLAERKAFMKAQFDKRDERLQARIADLLQDAVPAFGASEIISFRGQKNCNPALKQKMEYIEKMMPHAKGFFRRVPKGTSIYKM